ncbi:plasmid partitioning protein RepB [Microvirga guangxiensis]|uniref:Chromosome partitioning protein, ParB family n=1 Tax=Microvirga guangxiensis TaxID=549386 RepID=A0A1G5KHZ0_9HYPH|nr:plasmid partitioning protein RepB [Microvirga guangxiensis]SCZ00233.1 chromosome partitioning protein, ParB family [Microvirga guangxiensis]
MSRRDRIKDLYSIPSAGEKAALEPAPPAPERSHIKLPVTEVSPDTITKPTAPNLRQDRVPAGPVRSMGFALGQIEEETKALQKALASGLTIVELDPSLIDGSIIRDRLGSLENLEIGSLMQSIEEKGQEVPILVRPHPSRSGYYQIAYGHRRLKAVAALGRKVKAFVRDLSDEDLIVAQGVENSERQDLSYIERALFAARIEARGFDRSVIMQALSTDKTELSKLISVAKGVPELIIEAIGPAPKAGRDRWIKLSKCIEDKTAAKRVEKAIAEDGFASINSDERFIRVLNAASGLPPKSEKVQRKTWRSEWGPATATVTRSSRGVEILFDTKADPGFADFVAQQLDELYSAFRTKL